MSRSLDRDFSADLFSRRLLAAEHHPGDQLIGRFLDLLRLSFCRLNPEGRRRGVTTGCKGCRSAEHMFDIAMAFQPIVDVMTGRPFAFEALVRGGNGEGAATVLSRVTPENRYAFDQQCRVAAIEGAVAAGILDTDAKLSINFLPNAVYSPLACIQLTLKTARATGLPTERLIFEFTENEEMKDTEHVRTIIESYTRMGFGTAIDDFGAGHAGLGLLAKFQTDFIKLDMELIRGIERSVPRRLIVEGVVGIAASLGMVVIAEGVETKAEYDVLRDLGIRYIQGYLLARPGFRCLPAIRPFVDDRSVAAA